MTPNNWQRAKKRNFCLELAGILRRNGCHVYCLSLEKVKAKDPLDPDKFVPLMLRRAVTKFSDEVLTYGTTGSVVLDWSTHQLDHHITNCVTSMTVVENLAHLRGGVTYGSSAALPPLQVADIVASVLRRSIEGQPHVMEIAKAFWDLEYRRVDAVDEFGNPMSSTGKVF